MKALNQSNTLIKILILLSFLIHVQSYLALHFLPSKEVSSSKSDVIEIQIQETAKTQPKKRKRPFIKDFDLEQDIQNLKEKAKFLSRKTRRVLNETVARAPGITQNRKTSRQNLTPPTPAQDLLKKIKPTSKITNFKDSAIKLKRQKRNFPQRSLNLSRHSQSTFSHHLPSAVQADVTALNTDQGDLTHYIFSVRNYEKFYPRWVRNIKHLAKMINRQQAKFISKEIRITELQLILDKAGQYVGHIVTKPSGDRMVDFAVTDALKLSTPFHNPPKDLVEDDGFIYLDYRFRLEYHPKLYARE